MLFIVDILFSSIKYCSFVTSKSSGILALPSVFTRHVNSTILSLAFLFCYRMVDEKTLKSLGQILISHVTWSHLVFCCVFFWYSVQSRVAAYSNWMLGFIRQWFERTTSTTRGKHGDWTTKLVHTTFRVIPTSCFGFYKALLS